MKLQSHQWRELAKRVIRRDRQADTPCPECGHPIHWDAQPKTTFAPSVDHIHPRAMGGPVLADPSLLRTVHVACNTARSNRLRAHRRTLRTSRAW